MMRSPADCERDRLTALQGTRADSIGQRCSFLGCALVLTLLLVGCSTIPSSDVASFCAGVSAVRKQTCLAFQGATTATSDAMVEYAARQPTLNDESLLFVLDPDDAAAWDRMLAALEAYGRTLVRLTSSGLADESGQSVADLARGIKKTGDKLKGAKAVPQEAENLFSLSAAFTELGDGLLRFKATANARRLVKATDPSIGRIFAQMADAIDPGDRQGIRATVYRHWNQRKGQLTADFLATQDLSKRERLVREYIDLLKQQQAQDMALLSLRRSFVALADAHHGLAAGNRGVVSTEIGVVEQETKEAGR